MGAVTKAARRASPSALFLALALAAGAVGAQPSLPPPSQPRGLVVHEPEVSPGYVLFGPSRSSSAYLLRNDGQVVHEWKGSYTGGGGTLLWDGRLLRTGRDPEALHFRHGGVSGIVQQVAWDGTLVWEWKLSDATRILHHEIAALPNGNVLALAWETKTREEALAAGRLPAATPEQGLHSEWILEIRPIPPDDAEIVWEWHVWDHLVQDVDPAKPNHGEPAAHPGRLDLNALAARSSISAEELAQLQALGYVPEGATPEDLEADFLHANSLDYHAGLDQIAVSIPELGEVWILDHSTTTAQAATSAGGRSGRGGDILYRWGNPAAYGRGGVAEKQLFFQHDVRWIREGSPGAGHLTIFDNGRDRPGAPPWSAVVEIATPIDGDGRYPLANGLPYDPTEPVWSWRLPADHFAPFISGSERQPGGNTLACSGPDGVLLEVTPAGEIVWEFRNPFRAEMIPLADGSPPQPDMDKMPFSVFQASRIAPDHPALAGRKLEPLVPQPAWDPLALEARNED
jgi:hypothetical protein